MQQQPQKPAQSPEPHVERLDLLARPREAEEQQRTGAIGSLVGADLNVNLVRLVADDVIEAHVNTEVDVLLVGISGAGVVELEGGSEPLDAGTALYVPRNARRGIRAGSQGMVYLTCHRRRGGLMPVARPTASKQ